MSGSAGSWIAGGLIGGAVVLSFGLYEIGHGLREIASAFRYRESWTVHIYQHVRPSRED